MRPSDHQRVDSPDPAEVGGKAVGLQLLVDAGARVPAWRVLPARHALEHLAATRPSGDDHRDEPRPESRRAWADAVRAAAVSSDTEAQLAEMLAELLGGRDSLTVAVRSSGTGEDSVATAMAGAFETFLDVPVRRAADGAIEVAPVADAVRACWASAANPRTPLEPDGRATAAGEGKEIAPLAVVIQHMVRATRSGVAFTVGAAADRTESASAPQPWAVVSVARGSGDGLVSGAVDADTYLLDADGAVLGEQLVGAARLLADRELGELCRELHIAGSARPDAAVDVEFSFADDGLWTLQCRPVTAALPVPDLAPPVVAGDIAKAQEPGPGERLLWDNSNIIESFNGPTSPLTFSTAANVYRHVYDGYAASLGVRGRQLRQVERWTPHLLGYFHGRVYYNLLHWYRMVGIAPGYALNRRVLEVALGVGEPLEPALARRIRPFTFATPVHRLVARAKTTARYVHRVLTVERFVDDFLVEFDAIYARYDALDYDSMPGGEVLAHFEAMERDLLRRWGPVMVLDAALLTLSGLLFGLIRVLLPHAPEWFGFAVISPGEEIESAQPAHALREIAGLLATHPEALEHVRTGEPTETWEWLTHTAPPELTTALADYIERFGYRSLDELKLETPDLRENPSVLVTLLRGALAGSAPSRSADADHYVDSHLAGVRRRIFDVVRTRTSAGAAARERLRFARTRAFGMVKRMVRAMGRDLARSGALETFDDIFFLELDEVRELLRRGPAPVWHPRQRVAARRSAWALAHTVTAPARFWTARGEHDAAGLADKGFVPEASLDRARPGDVLRGTAASSGNASGEVVVVRTPEDIRTGVLVGYRTDPGWVTALPAATALLVERGSPLTHVAIVARELGIPTIVHIDGLTAALADGMRVDVDAAAGTVTVTDVPAEGPDTDSDAVNKDTPT